MKVDFPIVRIRHIIRIKRNVFKQKTVNKSSCVLSCRVSGESSFFFAGSQHIAKSGDVVYVPYGSTYYQESNEEETICFHFDAHCDMKDDILICPTENREKVCELFVQAANIWEEKAANYGCRCMSIFYEILSLCTVNLTGSKEVCEPLRKVAEYLDSHIYDVELTVEELRNIANFSRTYFNKIFKDSYGVTPVEYISIQRVKKAKFLLESGEYSNEEIALLCGFNNVKYFYVVFKRITGMTTKEYKRILK